MGENFSERRLVENEVFFRQENERMRKGLQSLKLKAQAEGFDDLYDDFEKETPLHFYCECADEKCRNRIVLTPSIYKQLHASAVQFIVQPGHEIPEVERVVRREKEYLVIEKFTMPPTKVSKKIHRTNLKKTKKKL